MLKELKDKKEALTLQIDLLTIESTDVFQTKTFYENEVRSKTERQNTIFQELKQLEHQIIQDKEHSIEFNNKYVNINWQKDQLVQQKDEVKKQIWDLHRKVAQETIGEDNGKVQEN
jgi:chromosome segregation ATPase